MLNNVVLMGRMVAAPELKTTPNGTSVVSFTLAVDRQFQTKGEEKKTDFLDCVAWRHNAEFIAKYFGKGDLIAISGEIQTRTFTDKNGNNRKAVEIIVSGAHFCGGKNGNSGNAPTPAANPAEFVPVGDSDGDIPF